MFIRVYGGRKKSEKFVSTNAATPEAITVGDFERPTDASAYKTVGVNVAIKSSDNAKTLTVRFKVKVPASGTIEVYKVGDAVLS